MQIERFGDETRKGLEVKTMKSVIQQERACENTLNHSPFDYIFKPQNSSSTSSQNIKGRK